MITVYYSYYKEPMPEELYLAAINCLPGEIQTEVSRFLKWEDRHARLFARLMLAKAFKDSNIASDLSSIKIGSNGKPFVDNCHFNISHSGNIVVLAIKEMEELGIDIEYIRAHEISEFNSVFSEEEWETITHSFNPLNCFFKHWVQKEAL